MRLTNNIGCPGKQEISRFPAAEASAIAQDFIDALSDHCEVRAGRAIICVAGSLRRRKPFVKDVEILFVPRVRASRAEDGIARTDLFAPAPLVNEAELAIQTLLDAGLIAKRPNVNGVEAWGPKNKLAIHVPSGMRVDLFTATRENFFNYLVCRTGGEESNIRICNAAIARGWKWNPYGNGFSRSEPDGHNGGRRIVEERVVTSEREVFEFVGLPFLEPWKR